MLKAERGAVGSLRRRVEDGAEDGEVRASITRLACFVQRVRGDSCEKVRAEGCSDCVGFKGASG